MNQSTKTQQLQTRKFWVFCVMVLAIANNFIHASLLNYYVHTQDKVVLSDIQSWLDLDWIQSLVTMVVIDTSVLIMVFNGLRKQAVVMAVAICIFNLLYLDVVVDIYDLPIYVFDDPDRVQRLIAKVLFSAVFSYLVHAFAQLIGDTNSKIEKMTEVEDGKISKIANLETENAALLQDVEELEVSNENAQRDLQDQENKLDKLAIEKQKLSQQIADIKKEEADRLQKLKCPNPGCDYRGATVQAVSAHQKSCRYKVK